MRAGALSVIVALSALTVSVACTQTHTIKGTVLDITEHTLTITTNEGSIVTFSTREVATHYPAGAHKGLPVKVSYRDDISNGFGNAERVEITECCTHTNKEP